MSLTRFIQVLTEWFSVELFGNPLSRYLISFLFYAALILAVKIFENFIIRKIKTFIKSTEIRHADHFISLFEKTIIPALYFAAFYFAVVPLKLDPALSRTLYVLWVLVISFQATKFAAALAKFLLQEIWLKRQQPEKAPAFESILNIFQIIIWGIAVVFVLDNLGFNVAAVVAGLGIGGVAVALAAQTILGDLFNYFVIFFDRPFEEGDFIILDDYLGVIEHIGIKSTRIRSLSGEQIVISNSNLTNARIRNYKRMAERRVLFKLGITYETPLEKVRKIPEIIKSIVCSQKAVRFDRAHFKEFGAYSLDFEVVYYVLSADYNKYMDIQQSINIAVFEAFQKENIEFAYPTALEYQKALD